MPGATPGERELCDKPCPADAVDPITLDRVGDDVVSVVVDGRHYRCYDREGLLQWLSQDDGQLPDDRTPLSVEQLAHLGVGQVRRQRVPDYYLDDDDEEPPARQESRGERHFRLLHARQSQIDRLRNEILNVYLDGRHHREPRLGEWVVRVQTLTRMQTNLLRSHPRRLAEYLAHNRLIDEQHGRLIEDAVRGRQRRRPSPAPESSREVIDLTD